MCCSGRSWDRWCSYWARTIFIYYDAHPHLLLLSPCRWSNDWIFASLRSRREWDWRAACALHCVQEWDRRDTVGARTRGQNVSGRQPGDGGGELAARRNVNDRKGELYAVQQSHRSRIDQVDNGEQRSNLDASTRLHQQWLQSDGRRYVRVVIRHLRG